MKRGRPLLGGKTLLAAVVFGSMLHLQAAAPVVSHVRLLERAGTPMVDIYYDVADVDSTNLTVSLSVSTNRGAAYFPPGASASGALGPGTAPGKNKKITWNTGEDLTAKLFSNIRVSVTASDDTAPSGMVLIPAGSFTMGNCVDTNQGSGDELPLHTVLVSDFYIDRHEVTKELWDEIYNWALAHGYDFDNAGSGKEATHPVQTVNWFDCVKWCNARSEKEGRARAYYTDARRSAPYKTGQAEPYVNWSSGYRLPTEAEWEKAARGGVSGHRFPWSDADTISQSRANYYGYPASVGGPSYDLAPHGNHPTFNDGVYPYTSPVGSFAANGYGLHDMAGNVWEWCWDWYGAYSGESQTDPRGAAAGAFRVGRGGSWGALAIGCRTAFRGDSNPESSLNTFGFRTVISPSTATRPARGPEGKGP